VHTDSPASNRPRKSCDPLCRSEEARAAQAAEDLISGAAGPIAQRRSPSLSCGFTQASFAGHIAVKSDAATLEAVWQFEGRNDRLNSSSPLNQINNQHDDCNYEEEMDQTAPNVTNEAKQPEHDQDNNYSPEHR
jgi:hypothetical protein